MRHSPLFASLILIFSLGKAQLPQVIDTLALSQTRLEVRVVAENRYIPWDMDWSPDGWLWFSQRDGRVLRLRPENGYLEEVFLIEESFESFENSGLHALALHPDFPETPYLYVHFTFTWDSSRLVRFTFDEENLTLKDRFVLQDDIWGSSSHNGSRIVFSPSGDKLFLALGDGYQAERAQDVYDLNGSILRYNLDGSIPQDNPFPGSPVWSYGHRNPQGLVFGSNGILYSSEHGTSNHDELNIIQKGRNYGWPNVEGLCNLPEEDSICTSDDLVEPLYDYQWTVAVCGTEYYDHPAIPEWQASLLQTSLKGGDGGTGQRLQVFHLDEGGRVVQSIDDHFVRTFGRLRDVEASLDGRVFICTSNQEVSGEEVRQLNDDRIIEIRNLDLDYDTPDFEADPLETMRIGPNPASEFLDIRMPFYQGKAEIKLRDLQGRKVYSNEVDFDGQVLQINRNGIGPGIYTLEVMLENGSVSVRKIFWQ